MPIGRGTSTISRKIGHCEQSIYGHAMFIGNRQKKARYLSFPVYRYLGLKLGVSMCKWVLASAHEGNTDNTR